MDYSISQNFITNKDLLVDLIKKAHFNNSDLVLDIGAGTGVISQHLAPVCKQVYSFEIDSKLIPELKTKLNPFPNITIFEKDFLKFDLNSLNTYKVFSNIPFSITSDIVAKLFFGNNQPQSCFLIMQKEAAQRLLGHRDNKLLNILLSPWFDLRIIHTFSGSDFSPTPNVDIVLLAITKKQKTLILHEDRQEFENFVIYTMLQQKPTLKLRLTKIFTSMQFYKIMTSLHMDASIIASALTIDQWVGLFENYKSRVIEEKKLQPRQVGREYIYNLQKYVGPSRRG